MAKWIQATVITTTGLAELSHAEGLILCSGQPATIADAQPGGSCFLASLTPGSIVVSNLAGGSMTASFAETSYLSGIVQGMANHLAVVSGTSAAGSLLFVTSLTAPLSIITTATYSTTAWGVTIGQPT